MFPPVFLPEIMRDTNINEEMERAIKTKVITANWKGLVRENHLPS